MEQSYFLAIALAGVLLVIVGLTGAWWKSGSRPEAGLTAGAAPAATTAAPTVQTLRPIPSSLRDDYFGVLGHLSTVLNKKVRPAYEEIGIIARQAASPAIGINYAEAREKLRSATTALNDAYVDIYRHTIPESNELFVERLNRVMDFGGSIENTPIFLLSRKASMFSSHLDRAAQLTAKNGGKIGEHELDSLFQLSGESLSEVVEKTQAWVTQYNERIRQE